MKQNASIIYINYSPYENSGKVLDYLFENFAYVYLFSLGFHNIKKKGKKNKLSIYHKGTIKKEYSLFQLRVPQSLLFPTLPIRSIITLFEIIFYSSLLRQKYGSIDIYFSVNAFTACVGMLVKKLGIVSKTVFWVWDYYPPIHASMIIVFVRKLYWFFDTWATTYSDKVAFVNQRLLDLRKNLGVVPKESSFPIIPIGANKLKIDIEEKKSVVLGFIGVIKRSQGLGIAFDNGKELMKYFPTARFEIIGSGPDEEYFKKEAKKSPLPSRFYGYMEGETYISVLRKCTIGIAAYLPDPSNVAVYGDAGKVKTYLSLGLPVLITDIFELSKEIEKNKAGEIIQYGSSKGFIKAIKKIMASYKIYRRNALTLGRKFYYKKIYPEMFIF